MSSELKVVLEPGIAQKLQFAVNRNNGTYEDIDYLSTGDNFRSVSLLRTGKAKLVEVSEKGSEVEVTPTNPLTPFKWTTDIERNIHFVVTSNGLTTEQWEHRFESRGFALTDTARNVLRLASEPPTNRWVYHVVVRPSNEVISHDLVTKKIRALAEDRGWKTPNWEIACLIRDTFSNGELEKMGLWAIATMHDPITDSDVGSALLTSERHFNGSSLGAWCGMPDSKWPGNIGFAFVLSPVSIRH